VRGYRDGVLAADRSDDAFFLVALAEYGRRYDVIVEVEVPLLEASTIKVEEDLPLELSRTNWMSHQFPLGDARSAHLEARSADPVVEIGNFRVEEPNGADASGWIESTRYTNEALAIYSSEADRPYYIRACLKLRTPKHILVTTAVLAGINLAALVGVFAVGIVGSKADYLGVLAIPATVAAAFVLLRDQTSLATRIQRGGRVSLAAATLALWAVVFGAAIETGSDADGSDRASGASVTVGRSQDYPSTGKDRGHGEERSTRKRQDRRRPGP
jgi:hypothetical protein